MKSFAGTIQLKNNTQSFPSDAYLILYSATEELAIKIDEHTRTIGKENFLFISPNSHLEIITESKKAILFWFKPNLLVEKLSLQYYLKNTILFKDPTGFLAPNNFLPYRYFNINFIQPLVDENIHIYTRRALYINMLDFLLIQVIIRTDTISTIPQAKTYDQEIAENFLNLLRHTEEISLITSNYANKLNITKKRLDKATQNIYGCSAKTVITNRILDRARELLISTSKPIKNISQELGFSQESNFNNFFKLHLSTSPKNYRETIAKEHIKLNN